MNLVPAIGFRTVYSYKETAIFLGMRPSQVQGLVYRGKLIKRHQGHYPFDQKDVNEFLTKLNSGSLRSTAPKSPGSVSRMAGSSEQQHESVLTSAVRG